MGIQCAVVGRHLVGRVGTRVYSESLTVTTVSIMSHVAGGNLLYSKSVNKPSLLRGYFCCCHLPTLPVPIITTLPLHSPSYLHNPLSQPYPANHNLQNSALLLSRLPSCTGHAETAQKWLGLPRAVNREHTNNTVPIC